MSCNASLFAQRLPASSRCSRVGPALARQPFFARWWASTMQAHHCARGGGDAESGEGPRPAGGATRASRPARGGTRRWFRGGFSWGEEERREEGGLPPETVFKRKSRRRTRSQIS